MSLRIPASRKHVKRRLPRHLTSPAAMLVMLAAPLSASAGPPPTPQVLVIGASTAVNGFSQIANINTMVPRFASQINAVVPDCGGTGTCSEAVGGATMYLPCSNFPNGVTCDGPGASCPGDDHCVGSSDGTTTTYQCYAEDCSLVSPPVPKPPLATTQLVRVIFRINAAKDNGALPRIKAVLVAPALNDFGGAVNCVHPKSIIIPI